MSTNMHVQLCKTLLQKSRNYLILCSIIIAWALSWPITKLALSSITPLWLAAFRVIIASIAMFIIVFFSKKLTMPKRADLFLLFSLAILQIALFITLINFGLQYISAGCAAILAYTTSLWVTPISVIFFHERLNIFKLFGLLTGIAGVIIILHPWNINWSDSRALFGYAILLLAAMSWGAAILCARYSQWHTTPLKLIPWQLLLASIILTLLASLNEPLPVIHFTYSLSGSILYLGLITTAFGYWGAIVISKELPATTSALAYLAIPIISLLFSTWLLHETITLDMLLALTCIIFGMACMILGYKRPSKLKINT